MARKDSWYQKRRLGKVGFIRPGIPVIACNVQVKHIECHGLPCHPGPQGLQLSTTTSTGLLGAMFYLEPRVRTTSFAWKKSKAYPVAFLRSTRRAFLWVKYLIQYNLNCFTYFNSSVLGCSEPHVNETGKPEFWATRRGRLCRSMTAEHNSNTQTGPVQRANNHPRRKTEPEHGEVLFLVLPLHHGKLLFLLWKSCPVAGKETEDGRHPHTFRSLFLLLCQQTIASLLICESPQALFMPLPYCFPSPSYLLCYLQLSEWPDYFAVCTTRR